MKREIIPNLSRNFDPRITSPPPSSLFSEFYVQVGRELDERSHTTGGAPSPHAMEWIARLPSSPRENDCRGFSLRGTDGRMDAGDGDDDDDDDD